MEQDDKFLFREVDHTYWLGKERLPSVTEILRDVGFSNPYADSESARLRGKYVHEATALYDRGRLDESSLDPVIVPYVGAWKRFVQDTAFRPRLIEHSGYHAGLRYAGTLDRVGLLGNKRMVLLDIKSGAVGAATRLQTAGYLGITIKPCVERYAVELRATGQYSLHGPWVDSEDYAVFLACLRMFNWKQRHK